MLKLTSEINRPMDHPQSELNSLLGMNYQHPNGLGDSWILILYFHVNNFVTHRSQN